MKKVLVTGGAGFIASHIVDFLIMRGYDAIIIDNLSTGKEKYLNKKAKFYRADITNLDEIKEIFIQEKPEIVIHAAAQVMLRKSIDDPIYDAKTNILGTINVLECCRNGVKKIIYTSTGGARYGEPEYLPVDEKHKLNPLAPYGISKHTAEHYVYAYSKLYGLDYLIFCFGNVYGPRDDPNCKRVSSLFSYQIVKNQDPVIFGDGNQTRDFIYVLDLAEFIVNSIEKNPENKLFNLANGEQISVNDIFNLLKEISGFSGVAKHIPAIPGEIRDICLDTSLAKKDLGWKAKTDFKSGLCETFNWIKENYSE
ncbi:GDP-L-fucose synthase [uncultured archaeon]|nr:GDP-L-fucose synthase [uncultured archaeon]